MMPPRLLLGPGPSLVSPRVLQAMATPLLGHLDPAFLAIMDEIQVRLRRLFRTANGLTMALSGTGSAGMEAVIVNLIEPGDRVLIGVNGVFGSRLASIVERCGGQPLVIETPWGRIVEPDDVERLLAAHAPVKAVALVQAETSTGARQPLEQIGQLCRRYEALFIVDAVTSLGGLPVEVDAWQIDACYSGSQKCLSCPPGLAPLTLSDRAMSVMRQRRRPCQSWYLDLSLIADYWATGRRAYHHTAPISMLYALREGLRLIDEEGLERRWSRHEQAGAALMAGLEALGLRPFAQDGYRLPMLACVWVPPHLDERALRQALLEEFGIEIGGGLGPLQGRVWRIGVMGESARIAHVLTLLQALEQLLTRAAWLERPGAALQAAAETYASYGPAGARKE